jgi:hypothetical protein
LRDYPIPRTGDFHIAAAQIPGGFFRGFHERAPDPLGANRLRYYKRHKPSTSAGVLHQWDGVHSCDT